MNVQNQCLRTKKINWKHIDYKPEVQLFRISAFLYKFYWTPNTTSATKVWLPGIRALFKTSIETKLIQSPKRNSENVADLSCSEDWDSIGNNYVLSWRSGCQKQMLFWTREYVQVGSIRNALDSRGTGSKSFIFNTCILNITLILYSWTTGSKSVWFQ